LGRPGSIHAVFTIHANSDGACFAALFYADSATIGTATSAGSLKLSELDPLMTGFLFLLSKSPKLIASTPELDLKFDTDI